MVGVDRATRGARRSARTVAGRVPARAEGRRDAWGATARYRKKYRMRRIPPQRYCFFSGAPTFSKPHFRPPQGVISSQRGNRRRLLPNKRAKTGNFRPKTGGFPSKVRSFSGNLRIDGNKATGRVNLNANIHHNPRYHL